MSTSSIKANVTTASINTLVLASINYSAALDAVRKAVKHDGMSKADARLCLCLAFVHHKPTYAAQFDKTTGKVERDSALAKQVSRELKAIFETATTEKPLNHIAVPANIAKQAAALWALCAEYEGAAKLLATAIANAKQGE
jgi:hypothetical protein